jgi:hypothetical protein
LEHLHKGFRKTLVKAMKTHSTNRAKLIPMLVPLLLGTLTASVQEPVALDFIGDYGTVASSRPDDPQRRVVVCRRGASLIFDVCRTSGEGPRMTATVTGPVRYSAGGGETSVSITTEMDGGLPPTRESPYHLKFTLAPLPDRIEYGTLTIPLQVTEDGTGRLVSGTVVFDVLLTEGRPTVPLTSNTARLAAEAGRFARGTRGSKAIATALTDALYRSERFQYDDFAGLKAFDFARGHARLAALLDAPRPVHANCFQITGYLATLLGLLGVECELVEVVSAPPKGTWQEFPTVPVAPIGSDPGERAAYREQSLSAHAFCLVEGLAYDATYATLTDANGRPAMRPVTGWPLDAYLGRRRGKPGLIPAPVDAGSDLLPIRVSRNDLPTLE